MKLPVRALALALACIAVPAFAADTGTLSRAESLRDKPAGDATVLAPVTAGTKVDIVTRSGGWYQVKTAGKTGWVRMLSVRRSAAASGTTAAGIAGIASGRTGTGKVVTTTGIRGLDSAELATAAFNAQQVARAESFRTSRADAEAFARAGKLVARDVKPLPAPEKKKK